MRWLILIQNLIEIGDGVTSYLYKFLHEKNNISYLEFCDIIKLSWLFINKIEGSRIVVAFLLILLNRDFQLYKFEYIRYSQ